VRNAKKSAEIAGNNVNPFNPQFGRRPKEFVGRDMIINDFTGSINDLYSPNRTTILTGIRGSGKTAILSDIHIELEKQGCMVVDVTARDGMLITIIDQLVRKGRKKFGNQGFDIKSLNVGALGFSFGFTKGEAPETHGFRYTIENILDRLKKKNIKTIFLIDEVHNDTAEMAEFATTYQHLLREEYDILLLMAGLPSSVQDVLNDKVLTFLRRSHQVFLENVDTRAVEIAYANAFEKSGRSFTEKSLKAAADSTSGYPYLIQLVGYYLWKTEGNPVKMSAVDHAATLSMIDLFRNIHDLMFREISQKDREFLFVMAEDEKVSEFGDIVSRLGVTKGYASKYRLRLIKSGFVHATEHGKIAYTPPFMKQYLDTKLQD
jgi:nucleoside-triphosphatase THEP1